MQARAYSSPADLAREMIRCSCDWDVIVHTVADLFRLTFRDAESAVFDAVAEDAYESGSAS
jgi:hypothetical protein